MLLSLHHLTSGFRGDDPSHSGSGTACALLDRDVRVPRLRSGTSSRGRAPSGRTCSRRRSGGRSGLRPVPSSGGRLGGGPPGAAGSGGASGRSARARSRRAGARPPTAGRRTRGVGDRSRSAASAAYRSPSTSSSPDTYARPRPSSPGAVTRRRNTFGERIRSVAGASAGPNRLPSRARTAIERVGAEDVLEGARNRHGSQGYGGRWECGPRYRLASGFCRFRPGRSLTEP